MLIVFYRFLWRDSCPPIHIVLTDAIDNQEGAYTLMRMSIDTDE